MLKILLLTTELRPGGAEKCLTHLACQLDRTKFDVRVVSIRSAPPKHESRLVDHLQEQQIDVDFLNCDSKLAALAAASRLKKIIVQQDCDIVQSFLFHANVLAGLATRKLPNVRLFTGIRVAEPIRMRHRLERWLTTHASGIVCVSQSVRQFAIDVMRLPESKLIAIPNGVERPKVDNSFDPKSIGIDRPYFLFAGRLEPQKGLIQFLEEIKKLEPIDAEFDLVFAGEGSLKKQLQTIALGLSCGCHFVGWHESPQNLMKHAQAVILPSIWEGMPNVLLESMSLGIPFVAFGVDGVCEITDKDDAQVIPPGNYDQFLNQMTQLLADKRLAESCGRKNQEQVERNFSWKKMIAEYESLYLVSPSHPG